MRRIIVFAFLFALIAPLSTTAQTYDYTVGQRVIVTVTWRQVRSEPKVSAPVLIRVEQGALLEIVDGTPAKTDGQLWWNVQVLETGETGWIVGSAIADFSSDIQACWPGEESTSDVLSWSNPPAMTIDHDATYIVTITTTEGTILLKLDATDAPTATNNFVCLANAGYYDGTTFHRIANDLFIQGGNATGTGTGTPGYTVPSDPTTGNYPEGSIALANSKPDENGAQFFITASDLTGLIPDDYPVFGHVLAGQDVVAAISHGPVEINPRGELSQPIDPVTILSITVSEQDDEVGPPLPDITSTGPPLPSSEAAAAAAPTVVPPPTATVGKVVELDAKDIAFVPTEITIDASDLPVTIRMENTGAAQHNFAIDALKIDINVEPQQTVEFEIPAGTEPGTYDFYCNIPGHKEAGMVGKLIIN